MNRRSRLLLVEDTSQRSDRVRFADEPLQRCRRTIASAVLLTAAIRAPSSAAEPNSRQSTTLEVPEREASCSANVVFPQPGRATNPRNRGLQPPYQRSGIGVGGNLRLAFAHGLLLP